MIIENNRLIQGEDCLETEDCHCNYCIGMNELAVNNSNTKNMPLLDPSINADNLETNVDEEYYETENEDENFVVEGEDVEHDVDGSYWKDSRAQKSLSVNQEAVPEKRIRKKSVPYDPTLTKKSKNQ